MLSSLRFSICVMLILYMEIMLDVIKCSVLDRAIKADGINLISKCKIKINLN